MSHDRAYFSLLNAGHFLDHLFMLIFASVAALALYQEWQISYAALLAYATPGFITFGLFSFPAGYLADKWSRDGMMAVFFMGGGLAAILTSLAQTPLQISLGLSLIGMFAAIYHPVGLTLVTTHWQRSGKRIAINGVWGNFGVAGAALITGLLIDYSGWRSAFVVPGVFSIILGLLYIKLRAPYMQHEEHKKTSAQQTNDEPLSASRRAWLWRVGIVVFITSLMASIIFQAGSFALPKILDERLNGLVLQLANWHPWFADNQASLIGLMASLVFIGASMGQLVVGHLLDKLPSKQVFILVSASQCLFFALMPGLENLSALLVAFGFMLGTFGEIPINDFVISQIAHGPYRARVYGARYVVSFSGHALTLPLVAWVYQGWGFDTLFWLLTIASLSILLAASFLPKKLST